MKNHRGTMCTNVKNAIFRTFGVERLPPLKNNYLATDVVEWKKNPKIKTCFESLFERNEEGLLSLFKCNLIFKIIHSFNEIIHLFNEIIKISIGPR